MNKNKIALGVLSAVIITGFAYQQMPLSNQDQQGANSNLIEEVNKPTLASENVSITTKNSSIDSTLLTHPQSNDVQINTDIISASSSQTKTRVVVKSPQLPADHHSASQPKAHGHEHQRRHPEDNSLLPPGEPKKPLPNKEIKD